MSPPDEYRNSETIAWHYTTGHNFIRIVATGYILPATAYVPRGERPAVWFSLNQFWEATANKGWQAADGTRRTLTREETREKGRGLVRFGVALNTAPFTWAEYKRRSGVHPRHALALAKAALRVGADPNEWRVSFEAVPREQWVAVEVWDTAAGCWVGALPSENAPVTDTVLETHPFARELAEERASRSTPFVRATRKTGRNEPCSCGSGKKFKKCCATLLTQASTP